MADVALDAVGSILVAESGCPNLVENPRAATTIDGWEDNSTTGVERVTAIFGVAIPSGTAIHAPAEDLGALAETDTADLGDLTTGDFVFVQAEIYVGGVVAGDVHVRIEVGCGDDGEGLAYARAVYSAYVPAVWFRRYAAQVELPAPAAGTRLETFTVYITVDEDAAGAAADAELYVTNVSLQRGTDGGTVPQFRSGIADMTIANELAASGTLGLSGEAWLSPVLHGADTLAASGTIRLEGSAVRLSAFAAAAIASSSEDAATVITTSAPHGLPTGVTAPVTIAGHTSTPDINGEHVATVTGPDTFTIAVAVTEAGTGGTASFPDAESGASLPATDSDGWTAPDVTPPDIQGLVVLASGLAVDVAQIERLDIELDVEGGPKSASMSVNCPLDRAPRIGRDTLLVTYKEATLFRGRLERLVGDVNSSTGYSLTYAGPLVRLRDHKAYRTVFVDSDLQNWQTDQGPQTTPDTFNGITMDAS